MKVSAERGQPAPWAAGFLDTHIYDALPSFALTQHFRVHFIKGSAAGSDVGCDCDCDTMSLILKKQPKRSTTHENG